MSRFQGLKILTPSVILEMQCKKAIKLFKATKENKTSTVEVQLEVPPATAEEKKKKNKKGKKKGDKKGDKGDGMEGGLEMETKAEDPLLQTDQQAQEC